MIIALFPGRGGWTIIKTFPFEFLCQRAEGASRPRLSALAMELGCDAFYLGVYDCVVGILLEADPAGRIFVSGSFGPDIPSKQFFDEQIDDTELISRFSLLQVSEPLQAAMQANEDPELVRKQAEVDKIYRRLHEEVIDERERELLFLDLPADDETDEFNWGYTQRIDGALAKAIEKSKCWYWNTLIYDIYSPSKKLVDREAKLVYFQPPANYKPRQRYVLTQAQLDLIGGKTTNPSDVAASNSPYPYPQLDLKQKC